MTLEFPDGFNIQPTTGGGGTTINNQDKTITSNGEYTADTGYTGLGTVTVDVEPTITSLSITPSTSSQTITAPSGTDGYSPINVSAVTSSIDNNITASNIKKNVTILGVTGNYEPTLTTKSITQNGTYNASSDSADGYSSVTVNVSGGGGGATSKFGMTIENLIGNVDENGALHAPATPANAVFTGVKKKYYYWDSPDGYPEKFVDDVHINGQNIQSASFPDLVNANDGELTELFANNRTLLNLDLSNLISVTADNFFSSLCSGSSYLTSVNLSNLEYATGEGCFREAFKNCYELTTISFPKLKEIGRTGMSGSSNGVFSNTFYGDYNLTTLEFPELTKLYSASLGYMPQAAAFYGNSDIKKLYFPKLTSILNSDGVDATYVFTNCYQLTEIHFGAANQAAIEANAGYSTLWGRGAGNATVYFDL